jgi:small GTP-binding protein
VKLGQKDIDLLIWDTAGQETYRGLTSQYYRDARIALVVFDVTRPSTLESVAEWHTRLTDSNQSPIVCVLVGNKVDLPNRQVSTEQGQAVADERKMLYRETSAVTGKGITEVFEDACEAYLKMQPPEVALVVTLDPTPATHQQTSCC